MNRARRGFIKVLFSMVTGGAAVNCSSCGGVDETIFLAWRIVDVWT